MRSLIWKRPSAPPHGILARISLRYGGPGSWELMHAETFFAESVLAAEHRHSDIWNDLAAFSGYPDRYRLQTKIWDHDKKRWHIFVQ